MDVPQVLVIVGLIFVNGFFVAAEFALVKVRTSQIDQLVEDGSWAAKLTSKALDRLDAYLSASQLGITVASLALGYAIEQVVKPIEHGLAAIGLRERPGSSGRSSSPWRRSWRSRSSRSSTWRWGSRPPRAWRSGRPRRSPSGRRRS